MAIPLEIAARRWREDEFYTDAVVLGIDVGLEGIGLCVRRGGGVIYRRTIMRELADSAALEGRRLLRSARRCRRRRKHRDFLLRLFCEKHLPGAWTPITKRVLEHRWRGLQGRLASPHALVQCLRHIVAHRGFSYHMGGEGAFLWGDKPDFKEARKWLQAAYCDERVADLLRLQSEDLEWKEAEREEFERLLAEAIRHSSGRGIAVTLERHLKPGGGKDRPAFRGNAWPREHVIDHLETICRKHAAFFGGEGKLEALLPKLRAIINYERKNEAERLEHARSKAGVCGFAGALLGRHDLPRAMAGDPSVRRLNLLDFLASRRFATSDGLLRETPAAFNASVLRFLDTDLAAVAAAQPRPKFDLKDLKKFLLETLNADLGLTGRQALKLEPKSALNDDYFKQLKDILVQRRSDMEKRGRISAEAAAWLVDPLLAAGDFSQSVISAQFADYRKARIGQRRQHITSPQVEFLLGRGGGREGHLQRLFSKPALREAAGKDRPDYVVIEVVGGAARSRREADEIRKAQLDARKRKEKLAADFGIPPGDLKGNTALKLDLFDQQRGRCPYCGGEMAAPHAADLDLDHIFPNQRGGTSDRRNLVLAHRKCNAAKGQRLPHEAAQAGALPLTWPEILEVVRPMRWGTVDPDGLPRTKRHIFEMLHDSTQCPDWGNLTRQSQIARELREAASAWLGIEGDAPAMARRIGTPTGLHTAVCRRSWRDQIPRKNRADLTHHLWDAITLSFIPPGKGLNTVNYGGIFYHAHPDDPSSTEMRALPVCPDLSPLESRNEECPVEHPRRSNSKQSRFDKSIYGKDSSGRFVIRKPLVKGEQPAHEAQSLAEALRVAGIPEERIPSAKELHRWITAEGTEPLRLRDGTPVRELPRPAAKAGTELTRVAHRDATGRIIGMRVATEANWRIEVWRAEVDGREKFATRVIPHPRCLVNLRRTHGRGVWRSKHPEGGTWRSQLSGTLPKFAKKVGHFEKGMVLRVPLARDGSIAESYSTAYTVHWYRVSALKSDGKVELKLVRVKPPKAETPESWPFQDISMRAFSQEPSRAAKLAMLLRGS
jgi:5-methylcytosine-specific restriction endonuclease McrA